MPRHQMMRRVLITATEAPLPHRGAGPHGAITPRHPRHRTPSRHDTTLMTPRLSPCGAITPQQLARRDTTTSDQETRQQTHDVLHPLRHTWPSHRNTTSKTPPLIHAAHGCHVQTSHQTSCLHRTTRHSHPTTPRRDPIHHDRANKGSQSVNVLVVQH